MHNYLWKKNGSLLFEIKLTFYDIEAKVYRSLVTYEYYILYCLIARLHTCLHNTGHVYVFACDIIILI